MFEISLHGRVALITGAASGIGRATALVLARAGAKVAVNHLARDQEASSAVTRIRGEGGTAVAIEADAPETLAEVFPKGFPGFALEHAAVIETSMMLHYHPELVRLDLIPNDAPAEFTPYDIYPTRMEWVPPSGVLSSARGASREKGELMCAEVSRSIAQAVRKEFG